MAFKNNFIIDHIHFIFHRKYFLPPANGHSSWFELFVLLFFKRDDSETTGATVMTLKIEAAKRINASLRIQGLADEDTDVPREGLG